MAYEEINWSWMDWSLILILILIYDLVWMITHWDVVVYWVLV